MIAEVVEVRAQQHVREAERVGARARDLEQLGLAVVAAIGRVLREPRPFQLVRLDDLQPRADVGGQLARRLPLAGGHRDRHRGQRQAAIAEHVVRHAQQQRRVDAAREADQGRSVAGDDFAQAGMFLGDGGQRAEIDQLYDDLFAAGDRGGDLGGDVELGLGLLGVDDARARRRVRRARTASSSLRRGGSTFRRCRCAGRARSSRPCRR